MTRINVVPVSELSDQHLIAEYRELPRVIKQHIDISDAPDNYCLGKGHMKWARAHWPFVAHRFFDLFREMNYRGFVTNFDPNKLYDDYCGSLPINIKEPYYTPKENDIKMNRNRLVEKYRMKPNWYRWTKREKPKYMEV